jgi:hypothetical protein
LQAIRAAGGPGCGQAGCIVVFAEIFRVHGNGAFRTHAVREFGLGIVLDVFFKLLPFSLSVSDFFAMRTYRQESPENLDFIRPKKKV